MSLLASLPTADSDSSPETFHSPALLRLVEFADAASFLKSASAHLLEHEDENNLLLSSSMTLAKTTSRSPRLNFFVVEDGGGIAGAALNVMGKRLLLSCANPTVARFFATQLLARETVVAGVFAPVKTADAFNDIWCAARPESFGSRQRQVAFRLDQLLEGRSATGICRPAQRRDLKTLLAWTRLFVEESGHSESVSETEEILIRSLENRQLFVWEDNRIVAMAGYAGLTPNGARVNMVYTDRAARSRGYAGGLVQALSHRLLNLGGKRFCFLFADAANAAANRVYERIGYRSIGEFCDYRPGSSVNTTGK